MKLEYFKCVKCEEYYAGYTEKEEILCGALVGFASRNGNDVPVGCGGKLVKTTLQEATEAAYAKRDNDG